MTFAEYVASLSPVAFWALTERTGTTATDSVGGRNGTYSGVTLADAPVTPGGPQAVKLNGGYVNVPDDNAFSSGAGASGVMSLVCSFSATSLAAATNWLMTKGDGSGYEWGLYFKSDGSVVGVFWETTGANVVTMTSATGLVAVGVDHLLVCTFDRAASAYLDLDGTQVQTGTPATYNISNGPSAVQFGRRGDGSGGTANARLQHLAYFNRVLTTTERTNLFNVWNSPNKVFVG